MKLQEYLEQKYSTAEEKQTLKEISTSEIQKEREKEGQTELLEGGELDCREFLNLEKIVIDHNLKTPLLIINTSGLTKLKEVILPSEPKKESEEEKKLFEELGISEEPEKKKVVLEVQKLSETFANQNSKQIKVIFATEKAPKEQLKEGVISYTEQEGDGYNIFLHLDRKDKTGNFCPSLVF
jgi:hypothetical protein